MLNKSEILAPAGDFLSVQAAVNAHADAVYLGGSLFSARAFAGNFDEKELLDTIDYCHMHDVRVYMAINTLLMNKELDRLPDYVLPYYKEGVDGIIVQDVGVVYALSECFPDLPLHCSTQMSVSSIYGAEFLKKNGFTRIVPSRELSLEELKSIKNTVDIELETFVHGAMCYCYSGRCLLSSFAGGRSGNRGRCAQPCRKKYHANDSFLYALSLKDMCTLRCLGELMDAGIDSFKIEGRMKKPEYVAAAVNAYRTIRDMHLSGLDTEKEAKRQEKLLLDIYNRGGFCQGYYYTQNGRNMLASDRPNHDGLKIGKVNSVKAPFVEVVLCEDVSPGDVLEIRSKNNCTQITCNVSGKCKGKILLKAKSLKSISVGAQVYRIRNNALIDNINSTIIENTRKIPVSARVEAQADSPLTIELRVPGDDTKVVLEGPCCLKASSKPVTARNIIDKVSKTGETPFILEDINVDLGENVFVQMSVLNNMRREAFQLLEKKLSQRYIRDDGNIKAGCAPDSICNKEWFQGFTVSVTTAEQVNIVKNYKWVSNVVVDYNMGKHIKELTEAGLNVFLALPEIMRQSKLDILFSNDFLQYDGIVVRNMDELGYVVQEGYQGNVIAAPSLYGYNDYAHSFYRSWLGDRIVFMSPEELTLDEIQNLKEGTILKLYGHQKVMIAANCIRSNFFGGCGEGTMDINTISDEMGNSFYTRSYCDSCVNVIYNGVPTCIIDKFEINLGNAIGYYAEFTVEDAASMKAVMDYIGDKVEGTCTNNPIKSFTRGHYYKGID